jgi:putative membrane protein (TIGR04086 family)
MALEGSFDGGSVLRGAGVGAVTAAALLLVASLVLYLMQDSSGFVPLASVSVAWLSVLASGASAARRAGRAGLWHGAAAGLLLFVALYLLGVLVYDLPMQVSGLALRLVLSLVVGAIGGVVGLAL